MTTRQVRQHKEAFLEAFGRHGNVSWACRETGTNRADVYRWKNQDDEFLLAWEIAETQATETMEAEAYRRAVSGTEKPIYHQGVAVGAVQEYSDTLLIFMLKARAPQKYRENINVTGRVEHVQMDAARKVLRVVGGTEHVA
jgi:hypothetical protein